MFSMVVFVNGSFLCTIVWILIGCFDCVLCGLIGGSVTRAIVPRMNLDELFEQKGEVAKAVLEELEKVTSYL